MSLTEIFTLTVFVSFMLGYLARDTTLWRSRKDLTKARGRKDDDDIGPLGFT